MPRTHRISQISLLELHLLSVALRISCAWFGNKLNFSLPGLKKPVEAAGFCSGWLPQRQDSQQKTQHLVAVKMPVAAEA